MSSSIDNKKGSFNIDTKPITIAQNSTLNLEKYLPAAHALD